MVDFTFMVCFGWLEFWCLLAILRGIEEIAALFIKPRGSWVRVVIVPAKYGLVWKHND
jgi:hypothetical protein